MALALRVFATSLLALESLSIDEAVIESKNQISVPGLQLSGLEAGAPQTPDTRVSLESLVLDAVAVNNLVDISVSEVKAAQLQAVDRAKDVILIHLEQLGLAEISASGADEASVGTISLSEARLLSSQSDPEKAPLATIGKTTVSSLTYTPEGLVIDAVAIDGIQGKVVRAKPAGAPGEEPAAVPEPAPAAAEKEAVAEDKALAEAQPDADAADKKDFKISIGELGLTGESVIMVEDRTVTPTFRTVLRVNELKLVSRDRSKSFGPMDLKFSGGVGEYASIEITGTADPAAQSADVKLDVADVNMIVLTPYTLKTMGYSVDSGHLGVDSTIKFADGIIDVHMNLFLRELYMEKASEELAALAEAEVGMPIEKAIDMLRKDGIMELNDISLSGPLDDFKVGLGDVIGKALATGIKSATINYLKFVNPTYGVGVTVLEKVKKEIEKIRIGPIEFAPGASELPAEAREMLAKAAKELGAKDKLDVRLCPVATAADAAGAGVAPADVEDQGQLIDELMMLGHQRANAVKKALVTEHGIEPGRLVICVTDYDKGEDAKPRVKLIF